MLFSFLFTLLKISKQHLLINEMDFNEMCRACLLTIDGPQKFVLFKDVSAYTYWFCTSIQIVEAEALPKMLCLSCYEMLLKLADFKQKCIEAQQSLLNVKHTIKTETDTLEFFETTDKNNLNDIKILSSYKSTLGDTEGHSSNDHQQQNLKKQTYMTQSEIEHTIKTEYFCEVCKKFYLDSKAYNNHKKVHENRLCITCNKSFKSKHEFYQHNRLKHSQWSFKDTKCKICGKVCKTVKTLRLHITTKHRENNKYICDICGKMSNSKGNLKLHIDRHIENKDYAFNCEKCNKQFKSKVALQGHFYRSHTGKQYICNYCNFAYKYRDNLIKHLLTHEGKKLHKCDLCDKSFSTRSYYLEHQRLHSGERPFNCLYCTKSFVSKRRLNDHHMIHTGERKHKCTICEQSFTQKGSVKRHMKIHNKVTV